MQRGCFKENRKCDLFDCPAYLHISMLTFCTEQAPVVRIEEGEKRGPVKVWGHLDSRGHLGFPLVPG
eukprot:1289005-Rhodomonas_salina.1